MSRAFDEMFSSDQSAFRGRLLTGFLDWRTRRLSLAVGNSSDRIDSGVALQAFAHDLTKATTIGEGDWTTGYEWIGSQEGPDRAHSEFCSQVGRTIGLGAQLIRATRGAVEGLPSAICQIALGTDPLSGVLREAFLGNPFVMGSLDVDASDPGIWEPRYWPLRVRPRPFVPFSEQFAGIRKLNLEKARRTGCWIGLSDALKDLGRTHQDAYRPVISAISRNEGCPGDEITLYGNGFGNPRPRNAVVLFWGRRSKSDERVEALVVSGLQGPRWTDTEITVVVPGRAGHGRVGVVEVTPVTHPGLENVYGVIANCFGAIGATAAAAAVPPDTLAIPISTGPWFAGGSPEVVILTANGAGKGATIRPGADVTLSWEVVGAGSVQIQPVTSGLPSVSSVALPTKGSLLVSRVTLPPHSKGTWCLTATNACGTTSESVSIAVEPVFALVLGGGGSKAAFEVGAARCLLEVAHVRPAIICGASAGALNAAKLAEGGSVTELEALWDQLQYPSDFAEIQPWARVLGPDAFALFSAGGGGGIAFAIAQFVVDYAAKTAISVLTGLPSWALTLLNPSSYASVVIEIGKKTWAMSELFKAKSLFHFGPTESRIDNNINPILIGLSKLKLRLATVELESGELRVWDEDGHLVRSSISAAIGVVEAAKASASLPVAFPARSVIDPTTGYAASLIDGGVRANIPVSLAVDEGPDIIITVLASKQGLDYVPQPGGGWKMFASACRTATIALDQLTGRMPDVVPSGVVSLKVEPRVMLYDTLDVDPGLIKINRDYGYMCAFDELVADQSQWTSCQNLRALADLITQKRFELWYDEHHMHGYTAYDLMRSLFPPAPVSNPSAILPEPVLLTNIRTRKRELKALAETRATELAGGAKSPAAVPPDANEWWQEWERHSFSVAGFNRPWDAWGGALGSVPAEPVP